MRCDTQISSRGPCNTPLTTTVLPTGRVVSHCHRCTWRAQRRCWQCGAPRTNHLELGVYCEPCRVDRAKQAWRYARRTDEGKAKQLAYWKARRADPAFVAKRRAYLKAWKAKNPEKVKAAWARFVAKRDGKAA